MTTFTKRNTIAITLLVLGLWSLMSCQRTEIDIDETTQTDIDPPRIVHHAHLIYRLTSEEGMPIFGAKLQKSGGGEWQTRQNGQADIFNVQHFRHGSLITISYPGFQIFQDFLITDIEDLYLRKIQLRKEISNVRSFNFSEDGLVELDDKLTLRLSGTGFEMENGADYLGEVSVIMQWVEPNVESAGFPFGMPAFVDNRFDLLQDMEGLRLYFLGDGQPVYPKGNNHLRIDTRLLGSQKKVFMCDEHWGVWRNVPTSESTSSYIEIKIGKSISYAIGKNVSASKLTVDFSENTTQTLSLGNKLSLRSSDGTQVDFLPESHTGKSTKYLSKGLYDVIQYQNCTQTSIQEKINILSDATKLGYEPMDGSKMINTDLKTCFPTDPKLTDYISLIFVDADNREVEIPILKNESTIRIDPCFRLKQIILKQEGQHVSSVNIDGTPVGTPTSLGFSNCGSQFSGNLVVGGIRRNYTDDQYYILTEGSNEKTLAVTDFQNFYFLIGPIDGPGTYPIQVAYTVDPILTWCENGCPDISARILQIGAVGELVRVEISGRVEGVQIDGSFQTPLFK